MQTQGIGNVLRQIGAAFDSSPVAKFTLEGLDFVSGPVIYGVKKIAVVEDLKNQAMGMVIEYFREGFNEAGYDQVAAENGAVGGWVIVSVGLGGFAGMVKNAGKKFVSGTNATVDTLREALAYRTDLPHHLTGPGGFTKGGKLSGTRNLNNAIDSLDKVNGTYTLTPSST